MQQATAATQKKYYESDHDGRACSRRSWSSDDGNDIDKEASFVCTAAVREAVSSALLIRCACIVSSYRQNFAPCLEPMQQVAVGTRPSTPVDREFPVNSAQTKERCFSRNWPLAKSSFSSTQAICQTSAWKPTALVQAAQAFRTSLHLPIHRHLLSSGLSAYLPRRLRFVRLSLRLQGLC